MPIRMTVMAVALAALLSACSQQPQSRPAQGTYNPQATQGATSGMGSSGDMQQMMAKCDQMMRGGHGDMPMSADMQKMMDDCNRMMQMHGNQPPSSMPR